MWVINMGMLQEILLYKNFHLLTWQFLTQHIATTFSTMSYSTASSRRSSHSTSGHSNPDSAIDISEDFSLLRQMFKDKPKEKKSPRIESIKLPNVFSSITAPAARLNPWLNSSVPTEADEWAKKYVLSLLSCLIILLSSDQCAKIR